MSQILSTEEDGIFVERQDVIDASTEVIEVEGGEARFEVVDFDSEVIGFVIGFKHGSISELCGGEEARLDIVSESIGDADGVTDHFDAGDSLDIDGLIGSTSGFVIRIHDVSDVIPVR